MKRFKATMQGYCNAGINCIDGLGVQLAPLATYRTHLNLCKGCFKEVEKVHKRAIEMPDYSSEWEVN